MKCNKCNKNIRYKRINGIFETQDKKEQLVITAKVRKCGCGTVLIDKERERIRGILDNYKEVIK